MKLKSIIAIFTLFVVIKGWVTILQPIALSVGAAFAALNLDTNILTDILPIGWKME